MEALDYQLLQLHKAHVEINIQQMGLDNSSSQYLYLQQQADDLLAKNETIGNKKQVY